MGLAEKLELIITADPKQAIKSLTAVGETAEKQLSKAETSGAKFGKTMSKVGVGMVGVGAVITGAFFEMAEAADKAEIVGIKLENSVKNSKVVAESAVGSFKKLSLQLEGKTRADHLSIQSGEAFLVQMGATESQVKTLTPLLVDLSRKQGVDLTAAAKAVGKAINGTAGGLQRMGVVVDKNAFQTDHYKATVDALRRSVGGFAEQEGKTFAGQLDITKHKLQDIEQGVGRGALLAFEKFLGPVSKLSDKFSELSPKTQSQIGELGAYTAAGLIAAGATATLAGRLVAARANMAALAEESPLLAAGLGAIAKGGLLLAGIDLAGTLANALVPPHAQHFDIPRFTADLLAYNYTGKVAGEVSDKLGTNFGKLSHAIEQVAAPSNATRAGHILDGIGKAISLGKNQGTHQLSDAKGTIDALDQSLTRLAQQDPKAASAALTNIRKEIGDKAFDRLKPLLHGYHDALAENYTQSKLTGDTQKDLATNTEATGVAASSAADDFVKLHPELGKVKDAAKELDTQLDGLVTRLFGLGPAQDAFQHDLNQLDQDLKDFKGAKQDPVKAILTGTSDAAITLRGQLRDVVTQGEGVIKNLQEQGGTTADVKFKVGELAREWVNQATAAGLPQPVIQDTYNKLIALGNLVVTPQVNVGGNAKQVLSELEASKLRLGQPVTIAANVVPGSGPTSLLFTPTKSKKATGGFAGSGPFGGPSGTDTIPTWLSPGEYVINARAAALLGGTTLDRLNKVHRLAGGGWVDHPRLAAGGSAVHHHRWTVIVDSKADGAKVSRDVIYGIRTFVREHGGDVQKAFG